MHVGKYKFGALAGGFLLALVAMNSNNLLTDSRSTGIVFAMAYGQEIVPRLRDSIAVTEVMLPGRELFVRLCHPCHGPILTDPYYESILSRSDHLVLAIAPPHGPNLTGVVGREAGVVVGYDYSVSFLNSLSGTIWSDRALDRWIHNSQEVAPGSRMYFKEPMQEIRQDIIFYLEAHS